MIDRQKKIVDKNNNNVNEDKVLHRFKIHVLVILVFLLIHLFTFFVTNNIDWVVNTSLVLSLVYTGWLLVDFELLQNNSNFIFYLVIAILLFGIGMLVYIEYPKNIATAFSLCALTLLVVQWPLRRIYLKIFDREPQFVDEIDYEANFSDHIYSLVLLISCLVLAFLTMDFINNVFRL